MKRTVLVLSIVFCLAVLLSCDTVRRVRVPPPPPTFSVVATWTPRSGPLPPPPVPPPTVAWTPRPW